MPTSYARKDQMEYEDERKQEIINYKEHVRLILHKGVSTNKRIAGIEVINAWQESVRKQLEWVFSPEPIGGQIQFEKEGDRKWAAWVLYSHFNKRFLASHYQVRIWEFEDPKVDAEIKKISDDMARGIKLEKKIESPTLKELNLLYDELNSGVTEPEALRIQGRIQALTAKFQKEMESGEAQRPKQSRLSIVQATLKRKNLTPKKKAELELELGKLISIPEDPVEEPVEDPTNEMIKVE